MFNSAKMSRKPQQHSAPVFHNELHILKMWNHLFPNLQIRSPDIRMPTPEFVMEVYSTILSAFEIDLMHAAQTKPDQLVEVQHRKICEDILQEVNLCEGLNELWNRVSPPDNMRFGLRDLLNPDPGRTFIFISVFVNFLCYMTNLLDDLRDRAQGLFENREMKELRQKEANELREQLNMRALSKTSFNEQTEIMKKCQSEVNNQKETLNKLEIITSETQFKIEELKRKNDRLKDEKAKLVEDGRHLQLKFVHSPEALKENVARIKRNIEELDKEIALKKEQRNTCRNNVKHCEALCRDLDSPILQMGEVATQNEELKEHLKSQLESESKKASEFNSELNQIQNSKSEETKRSNDLSSENMALQLQWEKKKSAINKTLSHLKSEWDKLSKCQGSENDALKNRMRTAQLEIEQLLDLKEKLVKSYEQLYKFQLQEEAEYYRKMCEDT